MTVTIGSYTVVEYPKSVTIEDNGSIMSFKPDADLTKAFDIEYDVADVMIEDLVEKRPIDNLEAGNIKDGVIIGGVTGTFTGGLTPMGDFDLNNGLLEQIIPEGYYNGAKAIASDTLLVGANIKTGVTIFGVESTMPAGTSVIDGTPGLLNIAVPTGYYIGTEMAVASDTFLLAGNIKPGITIFGVESVMPVGIDITGGSGVTHIPVPAGYYDGTTFVDYTP